MEAEREKCQGSECGQAESATDTVACATPGIAANATPGTVSGDAVGTVEVSVFVHDDLGLHARPAARVTQTAQQFEADVTLILGSMRADAKSILDVLSLAAPRGTTLRVLCAGQDAQEAADALAGLFTNSLLGRGA